MSEENLAFNLPTIEIDLVDQRLQSLEKLFTSFMETSSEDRKKTSLAIDRINEHMNNNDTGSKSEVLLIRCGYFILKKDWIIEEHQCLLEEPPHRYPEGEQQNNIRVLEPDIVYEKD